MTTEQNWTLDDDWYVGTEPEPEPVDPYLYVMGLDPGGTTGVAMVRIDLENPEAKPELIYLHQIADGRYGFKDWFHGSKIDGNVVVVSEKWKERNIKGADREPQYIEGGMHMLWGEESVVWQYPSQKELIPDDWLKKQNLWTEGKRHQMDALKHVFAYLRNEGHSGTLDSLTNPDAEPIAQPGDAGAAQLQEHSESAEADEEGTEAAEGQGKGEPQEGGEGEATDAASAMAEAMRRLGEAAQQAQATIDGILEGYDEDNQDESGAGETPEFTGGYADAPEETVKRTKRERNGAFAGYNPVGIDQGAVLFED